ncbi:hypothetical protein PMAYCL1PPCAC_11925 [Pristionchus mayeri]|uniref:Uncharacterized protein n=1 Tax=Pristionchus mayeri TaxID=1317129 RepID=A0AAN4ZRA3_9BILA|nr:hypothetical protein PMAYCL1PPCAC_11925 [Pristionchus mayeri]
MKQKSKKKKKIESQMHTNEKKETVEYKAKEKTIDFKSLLSLAARNVQEIERNERHVHGIRKPMSTSVNASHRPSIVPTKKKQLGKNRIEFAREDHSGVPSVKKMKSVVGPIIKNMIHRPSKC